LETQTLDYGGFLRLVADIHGQLRHEVGPDIRYGQTLFNVLTKVRPDIAEELRGTKLDPFHKTGEHILPETYKFIHDLW